MINRFGIQKQRYNQSRSITLANSMSKVNN